MKSILKLIIAVIAVVLCQHISPSHSFSNPSKLSNAYFHSKINYVSLRSREHFIPARNSILQPRLAAAAIPTPNINAVNAMNLFGLTSRMSSKMAQVSVAIAALAAAAFGRNFVSIKKSFKSAASSMESGWKKRGLGGSFSRTIEVWGFAITFLYKYVSIDSYCFHLKIVYPVLIMRDY